ncbi:hypothetical protein KK083_21420 [Fulvivirgaceae bacterium PWU4]|uniref:HTH cro/C1-type domain-containing protein n=1 Tax=Chryseosolibacter histidini TaxID=2782349 RepID=A0AAP2GRD7_9BACT|nr:hypothetical protein [Chryseosolibacter histidini]MBT1699472.1 hypothetical protein [Chryseosolibacter histidini]
MARKLSKKTSLINTRFLKIADTILRKNTASGLKPDSERALSVVIDSDSTALNKIRRGERNATPQQIAKLGDHFNLDFNYFFRNLPIRYEVYNDKIFLKEKNEELVGRMTDRFQLEVNRMAQVILTFADEIKKLESEKGNSSNTKQAKRTLAEGKTKLLETFRDLTF